jgi:hypothetical protein
MIRPPLGFDIQPSPYYYIQSLLRGVDCAREFLTILTK